ncbi:MAG: DinB family protein [Gemmatimonadota bacterium]
MSRPEPWLRGSVEGIRAELQPLAHELIFAKEELERILSGVSDDVLWQTPGGAASIGYHIRHCSGSTLRMLTYMRGEMLSPEQFEQLGAEKTADPALGKSELLRIANDAIGAALAAARATAGTDLDAPRAVGRKQLPSTVRGLFYEIALHTARHVGQIATTARVLS